jgi:hypothetical protein
MVSLGLPILPVIFVPQVAFLKILKNDPIFSADDCQALIWDVHQMPRPVEDPILAYAASGEVDKLSDGTLLL